MGGWRRVGRVEGIEKSADLGMSPAGPEEKEERSRRRRRRRQIAAHRKCVIVQLDRKEVQDEGHPG